MLKNKKPDKMLKFKNKQGQKQNCKCNNIIKKNTN